MRAITLALAVLAFTAVNAHAQTPNARVFNGGAGLILYTIKAASTGPSSRIILRATADPSRPSEPNLRNV